jgi:hypothetical protein
MQDEDTNNKKLLQKAALPNFGVCAHGKKQKTPLA